MATRLLGPGKKHRKRGTFMPRAQRPHFDADAVKLQLERFDRTPFIDLMVEWLKCKPTEDDIMEFASKAPGLYIAALTQLAKLSGFTEKTETVHTFRDDPRRMSDSELEDRLRAMQEHLRLPAIIDGHALVVGASEEAEPKPPSVESAD